MIYKLADIWRGSAAKCNPEEIELNSDDELFLVPTNTPTDRKDLYTVVVFFRNKDKPPTSKELRPLGLEADFGVRASNSHVGLYYISCKAYRGS